MSILIKGGVGTITFHTVERQVFRLVEVPPHGDLIDREYFFATCPELVDGYKLITDDLVIISAEEGE